MKLKSLKWQDNINDPQINSLGHQMLLNPQLVRAVGMIYTIKPPGSPGAMSIYFSVKSVSVL